MAWQVGELCYVAIDSWAGRGTFQVQIETLTALRARVRWLDRQVWNKRPGLIYNVPLCALRKRPIT